MSFKFWSIYFSVLKFPLVSSIHFLFLCWNCLFSICFKNVYKCLFLKNTLFIDWLAVLGLHCCARVSLVAVSRGYSLVVVWGLTVVASLVVEHRHEGFCSCSTWAQLLCSMWDLPKPGIEPVSPALQGRFLTTGLPGKPTYLLINHFYDSCFCRLEFSAYTYNHVIWE